MDVINFASGTILRDQSADGVVCHVEELRLFGIGDARYMALPLPKV